MSDKKIDELFEKLKQSITDTTGQIDSLVEVLKALPDEQKERLFLKLVGEYLNKQESKQFTHNDARLVASYLQSKGMKVRMGNE